MPVVIKSIQSDFIIMDLRDGIEAAVSATLQNCRNQSGFSSPPKKNAAKLVAAKETMI